MVEVEAEVQNRRRTGNYLLGFAWSVEAIAASIGLVFAVTRFLEAKLQGGQTVGLADSLSIWMEGFIAGLPFLAVSIVELTKIPLATAFYRTTSLMWKTIFISGLMILMFITFETFFTGFERSWNVINQDISRAAIELKELRNIEEKQSLTIIETRTSIAGTPVIGDVHAQNLQAIQSRLDTRISSLQMAIDDLWEKANIGLPPLQEERDALSVQSKESLVRYNTETRQEASNLRLEIQGEETSATKAEQGLTETHSDSTETAIKYRSELNEREDSVHRRYKDEIAQADLARTQQSCLFCVEEDAQLKRKHEEAEQTRDSALANISREREQLLAGAGATLGDQIQKVRGDSARRIAILRADSKKRIEKIRSDFDARSASLQAERARVQREIQKVRSTDDPILLQKVERLDSQMEAARANAEQERSREFERHRIESEELSDKKAIVASNREDVEKARALYSEKCKALDEKIFRSQVYRLAKLIGGQDVTCDKDFSSTLRLTYFLWFGSLSIIIAGTGTLLAFGGLVLKYPKEPKPKQPGRGPVKQTVRRTMLAIRRRLNKPRTIIKKVEKEVQKIVEVVKEVPVDKVVFKEVPKEVVLRQLVHVPLYTNDKRLVDGEPTKNTNTTDSSTPDSPLSDNDDNH